MSPEVEELQRQFLRDRALYAGNRKQRFIDRKKRVRAAFTPLSEIPLTDDEVSIAVGEATEQSYVTAQVEQLSEKYVLDYDEPDPLHSSDLASTPTNKLASNALWFGGSVGQQVTYKGRPVVTTDKVNGVPVGESKALTADGRLFTQGRKTEDFKTAWDIAHVGWNDEVGDFAYASEQLVFTSDDKWGNRIIRLWINRDHNVTARIRSAGPVFIVEVFYNQRYDGRWTGFDALRVEVNRTVTDDAERAVARGVAVEFAKAQVLFGS